LIFNIIAAISTNSKPCPERSRGITLKTQNYLFPAASAYAGLLELAKLLAARTITAEDCTLRLERALFLPDLAREPGAAWAPRERFF